MSLKRLSMSVAVVVLFALGGVVGAAKPEATKADKAAKKDKGLTGVVVSVQGSSLKIKSKGKEGTELTVATDDKTVVEIDGKAGKLADLAAGQKVVITPATGTATKIAATTKGKKKAENADPKKPEEAPKAK
jgi:hypothetical protein